MLIVPYMLNDIILRFIYGSAIPLGAEYSVMESAILDVSSMACKNSSLVRNLPYQKISSEISMIQNILKKNYTFVLFEALTEHNLLELMLYSPVENRRRFEGTHCLQL
jgi:hypothetical protein